MVNDSFGFVNYFNKSINIEFIPDEIVLKFISVRNQSDPINNGNYVIRTNLVVWVGCVVFN